MKRKGRMRWFPGILAFALAGMFPVAVAGQDGLEQVEDLVRQDRYEEARTHLLGWWEAHGENPPRAELSRGLWYRALLTIDPTMAELDYRRLVVEFPGSEHADEALLRLAKGAEVVGDVSAARRYLDILIQDYAGSPHRIEARAMRERLPAAGEVQARLPVVDEEDTRVPRAEASIRAEAPIPADSPAAADASPPADTSVRPDADTLIRDELDAVPEDVAPEPPQVEPAPGGEERAQAAEEGTPGEEEPAPPPPSAGTFTVQLGAFSTVEAARGLAERARAAGLEVRVVVVEGSDLARVRLGAFPSLTEAEARARTVEALGFETHVSTDRDREREAG
jgi:cell division septation protein DedD